MNSSLLKSTIVGALGGLLFGFDTVVIAGTNQQLTQIFHLTPYTLGITVMSALIGTTIGAILAGIPGDRYGRRDSLRGLAVLYVISALGCAFATDWTMLIIFRVIGGLAIGGSSVLGPMYIAEIAPAKRRGTLVGVFQFNVVLGILVAYFSNYMLGLQQLGENEWRWKLGIAALPAVFFFFMLFGIPRSPRWLAKQNKLQEARATLQLIGEPDPDGELKDIVDSLDSEHHVGEHWFSWKYRLPIFLAITIGMFNQLSGINAILYYLNTIFAQAGFSKVSGDLQSVGVGATNLLFTMVGMAVIDRVGRKALLLTGSVGTAISLAGVAYIFFTNQYQAMLLWCLIGFIAFFALSQGAVIWVYIGEVFPNRVRAQGQSLGSSSHWIMNTLISFIFPQLAAKSGGYPFAFFAAMMVLQFFVVFLFYPETKGISLEDMQKKLKIA